MKPKDHRITLKLCNWLLIEWLLTQNTLEFRYTPSTSAVHWGFLEDDFREILNNKFSEWNSLRNPPPCQFVFILALSSARPVIYGLSTCLSIYLCHKHYCNCCGYDFDDFQELHPCIFVFSMESYCCTNKFKGSPHMMKQLRRNGYVCIMRIRKC